MREPGPSRAQLGLLGRFRLADAAGGELALPSRKAQALLALLGAPAPEPVPRARIVGLLWDGQPETRARHGLRQLLSSLRKQTGLVAVAGEDLSLPASSCEIDVPRFRALATSAQVAELQQALWLYRGPLLEGFPVDEAAFGEWLDAERGNLSRLAREAAGRLASLHHRGGEHALARQALLRWLQLDPCAEEAHRLLISTLDALGERAAALQHYQACREALRRDLGVEPDVATTRLYESLRDASARERSAPSVQAAASLPALAVMPLVNLTRETALGALCAVIGGDLSGQLAKLAGFEVIADAAVAASAQEAGADIRRIARALCAAYLVTGSVRRLDDGKVRVAIQLVEGAGAQYLWTELREASPAPTDAEIDELVAAIVARLEQRLTLAESKASRPAGDARLDAWQLLRRAHGTLLARGWSEDAVRDAVVLYRRAVELDPSLALARAQKALTLALAERWGIMHGEHLREEARADAEQALLTEPNQSDVLGVAGCAIADLGDPRRALPILERAVQENAANAQAWAALGATQLMLRRLEEGVASLQRGLRISPTDYRRSVWQTALAGGLARLQRLDEAIAAAEAACRADLNFYPARIVLASVLMKLGRAGEAARSLAEARQLRPLLAPQEIRFWVGRSLDALIPAGG